MRPLQYHQGLTLAARHFSYLACRLQNLPILVDAVWKSSSLLVLLGPHIIAGYQRWSSLAMRAWLPGAWVGPSLQDAMDFDILWLIDRSIGCSLNIFPLLYRAIIILWSFNAQDNFSGIMLPKFYNLQASSPWGCSNKIASALLSWLSSEEGFRRCKFWITSHTDLQFVIHVSVILKAQGGLETLDCWTPCKARGA